MTKRQLSPAEKWIKAILALKPPYVSNDEVMAALQRNRGELPLVSSDVDERLLTPADVAKRLGLSTKTLAQWRWKRRGPAFIKVGGSIRYSAMALAAFLNSPVLDRSSEKKGREEKKGKPKKAKASRRMAETKRVRQRRRQV